MSDVAIAVEGLTLRFGGVTALDGVSFEVGEGGLTALIGPNGAGKTSLFNCLSGIYRPTAGTVRLGGHDIAGLAQHKIAKLGLARTFQSPALFKGLSVVENLMTGRYLHGRGGMVAAMLRLPFVVRDEVAQRERVERILDLLESSHLRDSAVDDLSYGFPQRC